VRRALERQRMRHGGEPPVAIILPPHVRDRDAPVPTCARNLRPAEGQYR
jgi:hypothetical protein